MSPNMRNILDSSMSPNMRNILDSSTELREMFQNPEFLRQLMSPEILQVPFNLIE